MSPGPLALVGSGEYLPVMAGVEGGLLAGRPPRYVQIPTAAVPDGLEVVARWVTLGQEQAARLGVEAVPLLVRDRADADDPELAAQVAGAGLVYLSGGSPPYLAATLAGTLVGAAVLQAWRAGAALAGCSAGAIALTDHVPDLRRPAEAPLSGLAAAPHLRVLPHFDRLSSWLPEPALAALVEAPDDVTVLGIDEETALVGGPVEWEVQGRQSVWVLTRDGRTPLRAGERLTTPPG